MFKPRPYQIECIDSVMAGFEFFNKQLVAAPTGSGKTIIASGLAKKFTEKGRKVLFLAHREELLAQTIEKFGKSSGIFPQLEKAEHKASMLADCVVGSVQSLTNQKRLDRWPNDHFDLIIVDECHHLMANSYRRILAHFDSKAKVCGITATPDRGDKKNLGQYFENIAFEISLFDLINDGFLSPISVKSIPLQIDLTTVRQTAGDYNESDLGNALIPYMRKIASTIASEASNRKVLMFLPLIATSEAFTKVFQEHGLNARHVDGASPDRKEIIQWFESQDAGVLCNAMLLVEGFDCPSITDIVNLRITRSRSLYSQIIGRGTRLLPGCAEFETKEDRLTARDFSGKDRLVVWDFIWLHEKHSLIRPAHLVAQTEEVAEQMTKSAEKASGGDGQRELDLQELESECRRQREQKLQEELALKAKRKARTVDAIEFALSIHDTTLAEYSPVMKWEFQQPSEGQMDILMRNGIYPGSVKNKGHATKIIDLIITRRKLNLSTPKQIRLMKQLGHPKPETLTLEKATAYIGQKLGNLGHQNTRRKHENPNQKQIHV